MLVFAGVCRCSQVLRSFHGSLQFFGFSQVFAGVSEHCGSSQMLASLYRFFGFSKVFASVLGHCGSSQILPGLCRFLGSCEALQVFQGITAFARVCECSGQNESEDDVKNDRRRRTKVLLSEDKSASEEGQE